MVVFDSTSQIRLLDPGASAPTDPNTGLSVASFRERLEHYVATLKKENRRVLVPTPALAELLVGAGEARMEYLRLLTTTSAFEVVPFDVRAALETALLEKDAQDEGDKRGGVNSDWQKVKYDRQIVGIARARGATHICSDDGDVAKHAARAGIDVIRTWELDLPPEDAQAKLEFGDSDDAEESPGAGDPSP